MGISKKEAAEEIIGYENLTGDEMLGVGDSTSDWQFIQLCTYKGAMGNASQELKDLVDQTEEGFIGKNVDENGVLDIFKHFSLH